MPLSCAADARPRRARLMAAAEDGLGERFPQLPSVPGCRYHIMSAMRASFRNAASSERCGTSVCFSRLNRSSSRTSAGPHPLGGPTTVVGVTDDAQNSQQLLLPNCCRDVAGMICHVERFLNGRSQTKIARRYPIANARDGR